MIRKSYIITALCILIIVTSIIMVLYHPLLVKLLVGQARFVGAPISAKVYTNGELDNTIQIYEYDNVILLYRDGYKNRQEIIAADLKDRYVGTPVGIGKDVFKIYNGYLIQGEVGGIFVPYSGPKRERSFDSELQFTDNEIKFKIPPYETAFDVDSIKIIKIKSN